MWVHVAKEGSCEVDKGNRGQLWASATSQMGVPKLLEGRCPGDKWDLLIYITGCVILSYA